jgi:hypothetical protein
METSRILIEIGDGLAKLPSRIVVVSVSPGVQWAWVVSD